MVEMEVAHRHDVDRLGQEPGRLQRGHDPRALVAAHRPGLVVDPLPDAGLDEDAPGRRLDEQAVERLEEAALVVDLVGRRARPTGPTAPARRACPASERNVPAWTRATCVPPPRSARQSTASFMAIGLRPDGSPVLRPASKSRWKADAVGSDWPWYCDPSSGDPYGRSTGEDILKNEIWPMRMP